MTQASPGISVVIPAYNRADLLAESLTSVFSQTRAPLEVIVVDDASADATAEVANQFPVTLIRHQVNSGNSVSRNTGISAARGELVAFLDSDDLWNPDHLECAASLLETFPAADLAFTRTVEFGSRTGLRTVVLTPMIPTSCYWELVGGCFVPMQTVVVRRGIFDRAGAFEPGRRMAEDWEWLFRVSRQSRFVSTDRVTTKYRVHPDQLTKSVRAMVLGHWDVLLRERSLLQEGARDMEAIARFDEITSKRVDEDIDALVYQGDYEGVVALKRLLQQHGARTQASRVGAVDEAKAVARGLIHRLPRPVTQSLRAMKAALFSGAKAS